jgi:histidyl-tRNA synthetase
MIQSIKGVKDILPDEVWRWQIIESTARRTSALYGYREIRVPIFESTELFARSIGATTDIVEKEMYTFADRDGKSLTLRPEATAGVVRAYIERNLSTVPIAQKLYYLGPMFRHERPQAGRLRQFHQFGVESFGSAHASTDVEVIGLLWRFLSAIQLPGLTLEINSLGDVEDRAAYKTVLLRYLKQHEQGLCDNCRRRMATNPLRVLDCKVEGCRKITQNAPRLTEHLSSGSRQHYLDVLSGLRAIGIPFTENPRLVRGLDYYTRTAFEVTSSHLGAQNAVGAGGRYDRLVETLDGPHTPAVGFAVGLERVAMMLPEGMVKNDTPSVYVAAFGARGLEVGIGLIERLRTAGVVAVTDHRATTLKAHLKQADRTDSKLAVILGDDEAAKKQVLVRDMATKVQDECPLAEVEQYVVSRLGKLPPDPGFCG